MKRTYRWTVGADVVVEIDDAKVEVHLPVDTDPEDAQDLREEAAYDEAVRLVTHAIDSMSTGMQTMGVRLYASIDGMEAEVEEP